MFESCNLIEAEGFKNWGLCLSEVVGADATLTTLLILSIIAYVGYKANLPHEVSIVLSVLVVVMMTYYSGLRMMPLMILTVIVVAFYIFRGFLGGTKN